MRLTKTLTVFSFVMFGFTAVATAQDSAESNAWEFAAGSGSVELLETFVTSFPKSEFVPEAETMIAALQDDERRKEMEAMIFDRIGTVTFEGPMEFGNEYTIGASIQELMRGSPAFPPVEGLPDEVWKGRECSSCHQWTRETMCTQANTYVDKSSAKYHAKQHPFGGMLKINLRNWALDGCQ